MRVIGLFAGIGGIEEGFRQAGHHAVGLCEIDSAAQAVLAARFPGTQIEPDVRSMASLPPCEILTAGFPCQDLSQAGMKVGIGGARSGLIQHVFRLLRQKSTRPEWVFIENVSYMVRLDRGAALRYLTDELSSLGYRWAHRVVDSRSFGIPQRRQRVLLVGSQNLEPAKVLFAENYVPPGDLDDIQPIVPGAWYGFYWTEGRRGIGWAMEAVPTVKGGSTLGIASPPAIWVSDRDFAGTPTIEDVERLQGFRVGWTSPAAALGNPRKGSRWTLTGNAVCVPMAKWVGQRIADPDGEVLVESERVTGGTRWPLAASGYRKTISAMDASMWPFRPNSPRLQEFLQNELVPLSVRATNGFLSRAGDSVIRYPAGFLASLRIHAERMRRQVEAA